MRTTILPLVLSCSAAAATAASPKMPTFSARRDYLGLFSQWVAVADTNGDGIPLEPVPGACVGACASGASKDVFVTKLNVAGSALVFSTYIGGSNDDRALDIKLDKTDNVYVTGFTLSADYPVTAGAFQTTFGGAGVLGLGDIFVTKLQSSGSSIAYSTYVGGSGDEESAGMAVDTSGNAYLAVFTSSTNYPITAGAFQTTCSNSAALCGAVTKLNASGSALVYSTFLAGSGPGFDEVIGIALDSFNNAYVTGITGSPNGARNQPFS